jgi:uncharacterized Rmd1/YagE family protein
MDTGYWIGLGIALFAGWIAIRAIRTRQRRKHLVEKYGSEEIADKIMARKVWQGMTSEQLIDSWGKPEDIDETVYKTKTKETWKYQQTGKNRFRDRVFFENGTVVGWQSQ